MKEILPEPALLDLLGQVAIGGCNHAHIHFE
jgi:hypothetical protein